MEEPTRPAQDPSSISVGQLEEACLVSGILGTDVADQVIAGLQEERDFHLAEDLRLRQEEKDLRTHEERALEDAAASAQELANDLSERRDALYQRLETLFGKKGSLSAYKRQLLRQLHSARGSYSLKWFDFLKNQVEEIDRFALELEENRLQTSRRLRELNEEEYQRRAKAFAERRDLIAADLSEIEAKISKLRELGITRTTAGFLSWAGYFAFPAIGWFLGEALYKAFDSDQSPLSRLVSVLASSIRDLSLTLGLGWTVLVVLGTPLLLLGTVYSLFLLSDSLASRFDARWLKRGSSTSDSNFYQQPTFSVSRRDYSQAVARIPVVYLWSLVPLGLAALVAISRGTGAPEISQLAFDPWRAVLYTYLGVVLAVVSAGFSLLYVCFIIERRVVAVAGTSPLRTLRVHSELVILLAALFAFVLFHAIRSLIEATAPTIIGYPLIWLILLLVVGLVAAYGLVYKGLFKDQLVLRRQVDALNEAVDTYSAIPAAEARDPEAREYRDYLKRLHRDIERQWERSEFHPREVGLISPWKRIFRLRAEDVLEPIGFDYLFEADLVQRLGRASSAEDIIAAKVDIAQERLKSTDLELLRARDAVAGSSGQLLHRQATRIRELKEAHAARLGVMRFYSEALARCKAAYHLGQLLRADIGPD